MHTRSIRAHHDALLSKEYSSVELTSCFLDRIKNAPELNAFISVTEERALNQAEAADKRIAEGNTTLLTGIPLAHKDLFCTKDVLTTCGSHILDKFISPYNATAVSKLDRQGMVTLGKTNMDEFAMGSSNETSFYGPVKNPWDRTRVPG